MLDDIFDFAFDSFLFFAVLLQGLLYYFFMVLSLSLLLYLLLEQSASRLQCAFLLLVLIAEAADDIWLGHKLLHFVAEVLFAWILQSVEFFDDALRSCIRTM